MSLLFTNHNCRIYGAGIDASRKGFVLFAVCRRIVIAIVVALTLALSGPSMTYAQQNAGDTGIVVEGFGETRSIPDVVEINMNLAAKAELTDDAVVKHRDSKKRALDTFNALKLENLELEEKNLALKAGVNAQEMMQMRWGGMPPASNKRTQVEVGSTLRARLKGIDKLPLEELMSNVGKLLDAAQDSGATLGMSESEMMMRWNWGWQSNSSLVKFIVTNANDAREKAYELAVNDAKKRADRLARLSGVKLGVVVAIDEIGNDSGGGPYYYYRPNDQDETQHKDEVVAETMSGGKIKVKLRVRFAIAPGATEPVAQAVTEEAKK